MHARRHRLRGRAGRGDLGRASTGRTAHQGRREVPLLWTSRNPQVMRSHQMPVATPEIYAQMLNTAKEKGFAFPAINVSSSQTLNAALKGFADAESDGIIQISTGGAEYLSGPAVKNMVTGSVAFAAYAAEVAKSYPIHVALHTDHCPKDRLDGFVRPLVDISAERVARGEAPLFQSHMWDG